MSALTALLALAGSFVGGAGGVLWVRRHTVNDRLVQTVLAFNQAHVRFAHSLLRLRAMVESATTPGPDKARALTLLESYIEQVADIQAEALATYTAVESWFGGKAPQTQIASDALGCLNDAHALVFDASALEGIPQMAKLAEVSTKVREGTAKRQELVEATKHLRRRGSWWRR